MRPMTPTPQFGEPIGEFKERPGAYAVITNDAGELLVVFVRGRYHLPGGGTDRDEDPAAAVMREVHEETGLKVVECHKIGNANQFLQTNDLGPINKLGTYFRCRVEPVPDPTIQPEADHKVLWINPEEFLQSTAHEFHRWAAKTAKIASANRASATRSSQVQGDQQAHP